MFNSNYEHKVTHVRCWQWNSLLRSIKKESFSSWNLGSSSSRQTVSNYAAFKVPTMVENIFSALLKSKYYVWREIGLVTVSSNCIFKKTWPLRFSPLQSEGKSFNQCRSLVSILTFLSFLAKTRHCYTQLIYTCMCHCIVKKKKKSINAEHLR